MQAGHLIYARNKDKKEKGGGKGRERRNLIMNTTHLPILRRQMRHILNQGQASVRLNLSHEAMVQNGEAPIRGNEEVACVRVLWILVGGRVGGREGECLCMQVSREENYTHPPRKKTNPSLHPTHPPTHPPPPSHNPKQNQNQNVPHVKSPYPTTGPNTSSTSLPESFAAAPSPPGHPY